MATAKMATAKTATHNLEPSQNDDNNELRTATNNICLSVIANCIIGLHSVKSYKSASHRLLKDQCSHFIDASH